MRKEHITFKNVSTAFLATSRKEQPELVRWLMEMELSTMNKMMVMFERLPIQ